MASLTPNSSQSSSSANQCCDCASARNVPPGGSARPFDLHRPQISTSFRSSESSIITVRKINDFLLSPHFPPPHHFSPTRCSSLHCFHSVPVREKPAPVRPALRFRGFIRPIWSAKKKKIKEKARKGRIHCTLTR